MPNYWLDVSDANGVKYGSGPIITLTDWTYTSNLDRAGTFSFTMPKDDPRAQHIQPKRVVRCWTYDGGALQPLGAGIIQAIQTTVDSGQAMLQVSGENLLAELTQRVILLDSFNDLDWIHPTSTWVTSADVYAYKDALVGDTTTYTTFNTGTSVPLDIYTPEVVLEMRLLLGAALPDGVLTVCLKDSGGTINVLTVDQCSYTYTTSAPYLVNITLDYDEITWGLEVGSVNYQIRLFFSDNKAIDIYDVALLISRPTNDAVGKAMSYAPSGWSLDAANGYTTNQYRPLSGVELISNGGFETAGGGGADVFASWTEQINGSATIETATGRGGGTCVKLTNNGGSPDFSKVYQSFACTPVTEYTLIFWTQGDGTNFGQWRIQDADLTSVTTGYIIGLTDTMITAQEWTQVRVSFTTPIYTNNLRVDFLCPLAGSGAYALFDDVSIQAGGGKAVNLTSAGETVLETLVRIMETTGEHFILSPSADRQVLLLGYDKRDSGMRALANVDPVAVEGDRDVCLIQSLTEVADSTDLVSRVYPYGGGPAPAPTLRETSRVAPPGFTLDVDGNCLINATGEALFGRIERRLDLVDIINVSGDPYGDQHGSNMLFDRAWLYLKRHGATDLSLDGGDLPRTYNLQLLKCDRLLLPGYTLRIEYDRYIDGLRTMHVNGDFWILSTTIRADSSGVRTVAVQCSTVDAAQQTDNALIVDMLRKQRGMLAYV